MVINKETKKYTQISGLDVDALGTKGASKFHWRSHLSLDKGPRFTLKIGFAPVNDISIMVGNTKPNYPLIQVGKDVKLEIVPMENKGAGFGLGFTPLLIYTGEGDPTIPDFRACKGLNHGCHQQCTKVQGSHQVHYLEALSIPGYLD